jgi:hypothetical protein
LVNRVKTTPFPIRPVDVVPLSSLEFTFAASLTDCPSLDDVCGHFPDDANRALVCLLRFRALKTLIDDSDMVAWLDGGPRSTRDAFDVAARLTLNERWEFDRVAFCSAVQALAAKRG